MVFEISPTINQGLAIRLQDGSCSIQNDLALLKTDSGVYRLIDLKKEEEHPGENLIQGEALFQLMHTVANGNCKPHPTLAHHFTELELRNLTKNSKFQFLCRLVPGLESQEHVRKTQVLKRAFEAAKILGKGLEKMEIDGYEGRYVGQNQLDHPYWMNEILFRGEPISAKAVENLIVMWQEDEHSSLSLKEWVEAWQLKWEASTSHLAFLPWITLIRWQEKEKNAWAKAHPNQLFDEVQFALWKSDQADPELIQPIWYLKESSGSSTEAYYRIWRSNMIEIQKEIWDEFKSSTGATEVNFEDFLRMDFAYNYSGSVETLEIWILRQLWQKSNDAVDENYESDFTTYCQRLYFKHNFPKLVSEANFQEWKKKQDQSLSTRYQASHLPFSFEKWKMQQDNTDLNEPSFFVRLDETDRAAYRTICREGILERNHHPFDTKYEKTYHSGEGYAIFVIGPDQDLYCGSHLVDIFHHSSFLGDAAIMAAGELKTDAEGKIIEISNKSGHYHPGSSQNKQMLRYFRDRGFDLSNINFTFWSENGIEKKNALNYLDDVELK